MKDIIEEFLDEMSSKGMMPKSPNLINGDDTRRNYASIYDKGRKHSCYYKLSIEGEFGYGYFGSYVTDEYYSFCSKSTKTLSKSELEAIKERAKKEREAELIKREKAYITRADEVNNFLLFMERAEEHPYLSKKQLPESFGALRSGENLIIPMMDLDRRWNYQRITKDGDKIYLEGAKKSGTWFPIYGDTDTIYLSEGFATGATINMATGNMVLVCFDCGNIEPVYKTIKQTYPESNIVLAADNDHEKPINAGLKKARDLNIRYGLKYIYPEFKEPQGKTDFNDLYISEGLREVTGQFRGESKEVVNNEDASSQQSNSQEISAKEPVQQEEQNNDNWREQLITNKNGLVPTSTINATLILQNDENIKGTYKFDEFSKQILIMKCPPWENPSTFRIRAIQDQDYIPLECFLEKEWGVRASKNKCADLIQAVAMSEGNRFNPAADYFKNIKWDGVKRLDNWLIDYVSNNSQPKAYLQMVGRKFMCGMAARAIYAGVKFDTMIIFEGKQYAGKSSLARIMSTIGGEEYFLDDFKDIENKDALMKMQGKLIVEFPEISTLRKAEVNDLKAFITRQVDEFRPPYGRNVMIAPRQCVFVGTVNPEGAYFKDMTGNRRYLPVACRDRLDLSGLSEVMPQLHAEAAHYVKNGEALYMSEDEYDLAQVEQEKRCMFDLWQDRLEAATNGLNSITTDELCGQLNIDMEKRNNMVFSRLQQVMTSLGFTPSRIGTGQNRKRGFVRLTESQTDGEELVSWN